MLNILAIILLAIIVKNPSLIPDGLNGSDEDDIPELPTPMYNKIKPETTYRDRDHSFNYGGDIDMVNIHSTSSGIFFFL